jgi:hypothetical protein
MQRESAAVYSHDANAPVSASAALINGGQPMHPHLRSKMEARFNRSFATVRIHADGSAASAAAEVGAAAFTVGPHIVFGGSRFNPSTRAGERLLAHELAHVVQQSGVQASRLLQRDQIPGSGLPRTLKLGKSWEQQIIEVLDSKDDAETKWMLITGVLLHANPTDYAAFFARVAHPDDTLKDALAQKFRASFRGDLRDQILKRLSEAASGAEVLETAGPLEKGWDNEILQILGSNETPEFKWVEIRGLLLHAEPQLHASLYARLARTHVPKNDKLGRKFNEVFQGKVRWEVLHHLMRVGFAFKVQKPDKFAHLPPTEAPGRQTTDLKELGRIDAPDGVYLRNRPGTSEEDIHLPFDTLVHIQRATVEKGRQQRWFYVVAMGDALEEPHVTGTGFVEEHHVARNPPEPSAHLYRVQKGDRLKDIAAKFYKQKLEGDKEAKFHGHDARVLVQAIYHANKTRDVVMRQKPDLSVNREALQTNDFEKAQKLWSQARVVSGQALWIPSYGFVVKLYRAGLIHHASITRELWDQTVGMLKAAVDFVQYVAGFVVGLLEGAWDAIVDVLTGVWDLIKAVWAVIKAIFMDWEDIKEFGQKLAKLWENRSDILDAVVADFDKKWNNPADYSRGNFQGEILGYIMMTAFLLLVSFGTLTPVVAAGRLAKFIKLIKFLDQAGDITTYANKLRKKVHLPDDVTRKVSDHLKPNKVVEPPEKAPEVPSDPQTPPAKPPIADKPVSAGQPGVLKRKKSADATRATRIDNAPRQDPDQDLEEVYKQQTEYEGSSASDYAGYDATERAKRAEDLAEAGVGAIQGMEDHHWVFVFFIRAIEMKRANRKVRTIDKGSTEGFRDVVDEVFKQKLTSLPKLKHKDLHRALDDVLDEMLEPDRVAKLAERNRKTPSKRPKSFGTGSQLVSKGGVKKMMSRLKTMTPMQILDILETAYLKVYRLHPGLMSKDDLKALIDAFDVVRKAVRERSK